MPGLVTGTEDTTVFLELKCGVSFDYLSSYISTEDIDDRTRVGDLGELGWFGGILQVARRTRVCINWRVS